MTRKHHYKKPVPVTVAPSASTYYGLIDKKLLDRRLADPDHTPIDQTFDIWRQKQDANSSKTVFTIVQFKGNHANALPGKQDMGPIDKRMTPRPLRIHEALKFGNNVDEITSFLNEFTSEDELNDYLDKTVQLQRVPVHT